MIAELRIKEDPDYYHQHGRAKGQKTDGYSQKAAEAVQKFTESYDAQLLKLYCKHCLRKKPRRQVTK